MKEILAPERIYSLCSRKEARVLRRALIVLLIFLSSLALSGRANAAVVLTSSMTVDNGFSLYISSSANTLGTLILSGGNWAVDYTTPYSLTANGTYYLHIDANNTGGPGGFLGQFNLSGTGATFSNGGTQLLTDTTNWQVSQTTFSSYAPYTPTSWGANGVSPWGAISGISTSSLWIWDSNSSYMATDLYFSSSFTVAVPEPALPLQLSIPFVALCLLFASHRSERLLPQR